MQAQAFALSGATNLSLTSSNASLGWTVSKYKNHQISFSDLGAIEATIRVYPACAQGLEFTLEAIVTGDNKTKIFSWESYGPIGAFVIIFNAGYTGTVYFGSSETGTND